LLSLRPYLSKVQRRVISHVDHVRAFEGVSEILIIINE
jgi:hypothetical protein